MRLFAVRTIKGKHPVGLFWIHDIDELLDGVKTQFASANPAELGRSDRRFNARLLDQIGHDIIDYLRHTVSLEFIETHLCEYIEIDCETSITWGWKQAGSIKIGIDQRSGMNQLSQDDRDLLVEAKQRRIMEGLDFNGALFEVVCGTVDVRGWQQLDPEHKTAKQLAEEHTNP